MRIKGGEQGEMASATAAKQAIKQLVVHSTVYFYGFKRSTQANRFTGGPKKKFRESAERAKRATGSSCANALDINGARVAAYMENLYGRRSQLFRWNLGLISNAGQQLSLIPIHFVFPK